MTPEQNKEIKRVFGNIESEKMRIYISIKNDLISPEKFDNIIGDLERFEESLESIRVTS